MIGRVEAGMDEFLYKCVALAGIGGGGDEPDPGLDCVWSFSSCLNLAKGEMGFSLADDWMVGLLGDAGEERFEGGGPVKGLNGGDWLGNLRGVGHR